MVVDVFGFIGSPPPPPPFSIQILSMMLESEPAFLITPDLSPVVVGLLGLPSMADVETPEVDDEEGLCCCECLIRGADLSRAPTPPKRPKFLDKDGVQLWRKERLWKKSGVDSTDECSRFSTWELKESWDVVLWRGDPGRDRG